MVQHQLKRIGSAPELDVSDDPLFACCFCGNEDDVAGTSRSMTSPSLPSTEEMADAFYNILNAPARPNDPLHFAVEALVPLQQVTKWASMGDVVHEDEMTMFLTDVEKVRGVGIIVKFLSNHINDPAAATCSVRALYALLVDAGDVDSDFPTGTRGVNMLARQRTQLIRDFLNHHGMETLTRAFTLHALTPSNRSTRSQSEELYSLMELRIKSICVLGVAVPHSAPENVAKTLRFLCSVTPQMVGLLTGKDQRANKVLLERTILGISNAIQVDGINRKLKMEDTVAVVDVSVQVMKAYPKNYTKIHHDVRVLWSWAANFGSS
jgi:hypothetical protein